MSMETGGQTRVRILNVDDTEATRMLVSRILTKAGFEMLEATTAAQALEMVQTLRPDMVILDVRLPDGSGLDACRRIKTDPVSSPTPVLQVSATFVGEEDKARGLDVGADAYLTHPLEPLVLIATVNALLRMRKAEDALRASAREWRTTFDAISDCVALLDRDATILRHNRAFESLVGSRDDGHTGRSAWQVLQPAFEGTESLERYFRRETETPVSLKMRLEDRWFLAKSDPLTDGHGAFEGAVLILSDITERRRAEMLLRDHQQHIEQLNRHLQRAMTETHHRVKNNLQIVAGMMEMEIAEGTPTVSVEQLKKLGSCVRTLASLHDLLTYESKSGERTERVSAGRLLEKLLPMLRHSAPRHTLEWSVEDASLGVRAATSLALTLNELVNNAAKHDHRWISVRFSVKDGEAEMRVEDDGAGFPAGFDPSKQASTGLELVQMLTRWDLRGEARFQNRPEGGARALVTFPLSASEEAAPEGNSP